MLCFCCLAAPSTRKAASNARTRLAAKRLMNLIVPEGEGRGEDDTRSKAQRGGGHLPITT